MEVIGDDDSSDNEGDDHDDVFKCYQVLITVLVNVCKNDFEVHWLHTREGKLYI